MQKIPSFSIDHIRLNRGIYVSRKDEVGGEVVTTFDIRMKLPNREPVLGQGAIHTIEHLAATYLRNNAEWKDRIVYWGPMGCLTGNYLLMRGDLTSSDILPLMKETFRFIAEFDGEIPGAAIAALTCSTTCPWHAMRLQSICTKCWNAPPTRISTIPPDASTSLLHPAPRRTDKGKQPLKKSIIY